MAEPKVSICLPTLNAAAFLDPRLESISSQTCGDWELIVCDSFSDDGTWKLFQSYAADPRVRLFQVPKEGLYAGWNECLRRCRGEYVYIATADDTCSPQCLEKLVGALERAKTGKTEQEEAEGAESGRSIDIAVCDFDFIDERGDVIDPPRSVPSCELGKYIDLPHIRSGLYDFLVSAILGVSWTTMTSVCFRRSLLDKTGLFRTDCGVSADRFWAMKACAESDVVYVPEKLATWRFHGEQQSGVMSRGDYRLVWQRLLETIREC